MAKYKTGVIPIYTNAAGVKRMFGIARGKLQDWINLGLPAVEPDVFNVREVVKWHKAESNIAVKGKSNAETVAAERVQIARAEKLERDNLIEVKQLVPVEDIKSAFDLMATIVANSFESMGARLCNQVAGMDDAAEIQALIWNEARDVRRLIADRFDELEVPIEVD